MILATGNRPRSNPYLFKGGQGGFTLIEVLVAILLLSVGLVWIVEGYGSILNATRKAQRMNDGGWVLHEKMAEQELDIRVGRTFEGRLSGQEGAWKWSTEVKQTEKKGWYELSGEVSRKGDEGTISHITYVRDQRVHTY